MKKWQFFGLIVLVSLALTACSIGAEPMAEAIASPPPSETPTQEPPPTEPPAPTNTPTESPPTLTPTPEPTETPDVEALPAKPQELSFQTSDGQTLNGRYYPGASDQSPLVVLMHWAPGDQEDWNEIAFWLQNRGLSGNSPNLGETPWLDPSWFPPMPEDQSFAVFTFTFRGCEGGCSTFDRSGWLLDAQSALDYARTLERVDPNRIVALGASIGADGAPDGCFWLNDQVENSCLGALSLSPGSYLTVPYADAVQALGEEAPPKPVNCFYDPADQEAARACQSAGGDHYEAFEWTDGGHGMNLLRPELEPNAMKLILDFLARAFEL
jgi:hypothetical protein